MEINVNCRICLEQHALLDWNEEILDSYGTTYKYCYYKYTHLDDHVTDPFSQMLCENCSTELRNAHFLIQKAIESYQVLQQTSANSLISTTKAENDTYQDHGDSSDLEIILFEQSTTSSIEDDDNRIISMVDTSMETPKDLKKEHVNKKSKVQKTKLEKDDNFAEELEEYMNNPQSPLNISSLISQDESSKEVKKKSRIICAYCSKLISLEHIKQHEETHKDRERKAMCPKCGIKLYNKTALHTHMIIHEENREKKYKCEFCNKAYFNRGGLTIHQRVHLGQMIPCTICSKQFYRQVDLDRHNVKSHSASLLHTNFKGQPNYYVECKHCGKSILSHRWRDHRDTHLKKFQMKCTLCDKHFITKPSCHKHMRHVHKKTKDDYAKLVIYYGEDVDKRISHLMMKQIEKVKPILE